MCDFFNYASFCIAVLTILVTVLVCWQIYNYTQMEKHVRRILDERAKSITEDFKEILHGIVKLNLYSHSLKDDCAALVDNCFESLRNIGECQNKELSGFAIDMVMNLLHELSVRYKDKCTVLPGKKGLYLFVLSKIDHPYQKDISNMLDTAKEIAGDASKLDYVGDLSGEDINSICK